MTQCTFLQLITTLYVFTWCNIDGFVYSNHCNTYVWGARCLSKIGKVTSQLNVQLHEIKVPGKNVWKPTSESFSYEMSFMRKFGKCIWQIFIFEVI